MERKWTINEKKKENAINEIKSEREAEQMIVICCLKLNSHEI